ncbi:MAG: hypothetical protein KDA84_02355, partial [Planctomycetaceae bacterium]|nr:hypothetical protein [Planctomycetaceae bacterium]
DPNIRHWIAMGALAVGDYEEATKQWTTQAEELQQIAVLSVMGGLPMANRPLDPVPMLQQLMLLRNRDTFGYSSWPAGAYASGASIQTAGFPSSLPLDASLPLLNVALCQVELGQSEKAVERFKQLLEVDPNSRYRPLAAFYIRALTGEIIDEIPPSAYVPVWDGMFAPDPAIAEKPEKKAPTETPKPTEKPE